MSFLDAIVGTLQSHVENNTQAQENPLASVMGLLNNPAIGGLPGLMAKFSEQGLGGHVASWIGSGENLPISSEQLEAVLGSSVVQEIAAKFGIDSSSAAGILAGMLPQVVDHLTSSGQTPESGSDISQVLSGLSGLFGKSTA
jgi:uncharacterized protein YidB (DUF937 family)